MSKRDSFRRNIIPAMLADLLVLLLFIGLPILSLKLSDIVFDFWFFKYSFVNPETGFSIYGNIGVQAVGRILFITFSSVVSGILAFMYSDKIREYLLGFPVLLRFRSSHLRSSTQDAVIVLFLKDQNRQFLRAFIIFILFFIWIGVIHLESNQQVVKHNVPLILVGVLTALLIREVLLEYRILRGYYGNNRHEAREIIKFIQQNSENWQSPGGGVRNRREVFSEEKIEQEEIADDKPGEIA
jgi:hypothetical protein